MTKTLKYRLKIIGLILLSIFFAIVIFASIYGYFNAEKYLNKNLSQIVADKTDNLYNLSFDEIELKTSPLSISVTKISLKPNQEKVDEIIKTQPDKSFFTLNSPELRITNFNFLKYLRENIFHCKNLIVVEPDFSISGEKILQNDSTKNADNILREVRPVFQNNLKKISIEKIHFIDANYKLYHSVSDSRQISNAQKISIEILKFNTDSTMIFSNTRFFDSDDILVSIKHFQNNLSDSIHFLEIDTLKYSLKTTDIFAHGFHLGHKVKNAQKNLFDVRVPSLHLKSKSIAGLSLKDSLNVEYLNFEKPTIRFYQKENKKKLEIDDINQFDLYSLVETQFEAIEVDTFVLTDADLKIFQQADTTSDFQQHFQSLTISLNGFKLDSVSARDKQKLFHSNDINMLVKGYLLKLKDNQHEFNADSIFVSTTTNSLGIKNIQIFPIDQEENKTRTNVNVKCKSLGIENVNLKILYHTRTIPTRRISIANPEVHLQYHSEIARKKEKKEAGLLFNLVSAYLQGVYSEVVEIKNGNLNIETLKNSVLKGYFETGFNFNLSGFALDSASMEQTDKFFYASHFDLEFSDYQMKLTDNLHKINVDRISILSFDRKLQIQNLRLKPAYSTINHSIMQQYNRSELYNISIPEITLWGINLRDAFFYNKLNIWRFQVTKPKIYFENFGILRQTAEKKEFSELIQLIFNYISDIDIKEISAPNGKFTWVNHTKKGKTTSFDNAFSATLNNFRLNEDELNKQRLLFSDNFKISLKDQQFQLSDSVHILKASEIEFVSEEERVEINNALLYPVILSEKYNKLSTTFQVAIPKLEIHNFDFSRSYFSRELKLNTLELNSPKFEIYSKTGTNKSLDLKKFDIPIPTFVNSFHLKEFKINNGEVINYQVKGNKQFAQSNFRLNLSIPNIILKNTAKNSAKLTTGNLIVNIFDFKAPLGKNHEIRMANLDFNRNKKNISLSQIEINPFAPKQSGNRFTISAPTIHFSAFDMNNAIQNNQFDFNEITINQPDITIEINDSIEGDKLEFAKNLDLYSYAEPYLNGIKVNKLQLENVKLNFNWFEKKLIDKRFNLNFNEINIAENVQGENLLNSKEFEISTTNLKTKSKNGFYEFSADTLIYNSARHNTLLKNVSINPLLSMHEFHTKIDFQTDFLKAKSEFIEIRGIDENEWLKQNTVSAKKLVIGPSMFDIFRNKRLPFNANQRPPWPQNLIKEIPQPFIFDSVRFLPSTIKYSELMDLTDKPGFVEFNNLEFLSTQLSNIPEVIKNKPLLQIDAKANLFNQGLLTAQLNFDLGSNNNHHTIVGNLQPMPLKPLNAMLEKSVPIAIESGQLNRFDFNFTFDEKQANGHLYLGYDDFKISVYESDINGTKKSRLASFWANNMVLNSKYPKGDKFEPTIVTYTRDPQRSILNYWWKTIFKGSKETIGIKEEQTKE